MERRLTWVLILCGLVAAGCGGVLTANNSENLRAQEAVSAGDPASALRALANRNDLPGRLDRAVILGEMGRPRESNVEFDGALQLIRDFESRARISAQETARGASSLLVNDKTLEYQGSGYEKVLIHALKARNYLILGQAEEARVEIRNANMRQDEERKAHQKDIAATQADAKNNHLDMHAIDAEINRQFGAQSSIITRVSSAYQNPFATYLSGVVYEANDEPGDAFVDYKNAYRIVPSPLIAGEIGRLSQRLNRRDESAALGITVPKGKAVAAGNTLVIVDNGFAPRRRELKFPLPTPQTALFVAVPLTDPVPTDLGEVEVLDATGATIGKTEMLVDIEALSVRDLHDRYPGILVRQFIRAAAKEGGALAAQKAAGNNTAAVLAAGIGTSLMNAVTEQADLRTWYALPRSVHVAHVTTPPGETEATLRLLDGGGRLLRDVKVPIASPPGKLKLVVVRYVDGRVLVQTPEIAAAGAP